MSTLHTLYRPQTWDQVYGQTAVVQALRGAVEQRSAQTFLLSGPSGTGKTSLARIAARELGCDGATMEIDAATVTGIDAMREIQQLAQYRPMLSQAENRAIIIDEAHALSRPAVESLLKVTEEPPDHVYWFFCTTVPDKIPATLQTRSLHLKLKSLNDSDLEALYNGICAAEGITIPPDIGKLILREAGGSPRQLLVNIGACRTVTSKRDAAEILQAAIESPGVIALCRLLVKGGSWSRAMAIYEGIEEEDPESVRIIIMQYVGKALRGAKSDDEARFYLNLLQIFEQPFYNPTAKSQLLTGIGAALLGG